MTPVFVNLNKGNPLSRIYAGNLDLVNGYKSDSEFEGSLKFQALFYKHILVPDSFLHCYGPALESVIHLSTGGRHPETNTLLTLLKAGVIVPALRERASLLENFRKGVRGIVPGRYLMPSRKEAEPSLELMEKHITAVTEWPHEMRKQHDPQYFGTLYSLFFDLSASGESAEEELIAYLHLNTRQDASWRSLLSDFLEVIETQKTKPGGGKLRRALLEDVMVRHLKVSFKDLYQSLRHHSNSSLDRFRLGAFLMDLVGTVYEAYQAENFKAVGGLFSRCRADLIDAKFYARSGSLKEGVCQPFNQQIPIDLFDCSKIPVEKILAFREGRIFARYQELLETIVPAEAGHTIAETNQPFCAYLGNDFAKAIIDLAPEIVKERQIKTAASIVQYGTPLIGGGGLVGTHLAGVVGGVAETILFGGIVVLTIVGAIAKDSAPSIHEFIQNRRKAADVMKIQRRLNNFVPRR